MKKSLFKNKNSQRGFTIIEVFVGITILLIGIVGPMVLVNRNMQAARFSRDQITAYYLAQEAIEVVRQVRDTNMLSSNSNWLARFPANCSNGCIVNADKTANSNDKIKICSQANCTSDPERNLGEKKLVINNQGRYVHGGSGIDANISRYIKISGVDDQRTITVVVEFDAGRYFQKYETVSTISNWAPGR